MKLGGATGPKAGGAGRDGGVKPAARNERVQGGGRGASGGAAAGASQGQSAMAAAFAKLQTKR